MLDLSSVPANQAQAIRHVSPQQAAFMKLQSHSTTSKQASPKAHQQQRGDRGDRPRGGEKEDKDVRVERVLEIDST